MSPIHIVFFRMGCQELSQEKIDDAGINAVLMKPLDMNKLSQTLNELLARTRS